MKMPRSRMTAEQMMVAIAALATISTLHGNRIVNAQIQEPGRELLRDQPIVDRLKWDWSDDRATAKDSANRFGSEEYRVGLAQEPPVVRGHKRKPGPLRINVSRGDEQVLSWDGHQHSVFVQDGDVLYYTDFQDNSNGCTVIAYDMAKRRQVWRTHLKGIRVLAHSQYRNRINISKIDGTIVVYGKESFGRYIEVIDPGTGKTVGHKLVTKGTEAP
jgi:hypothetical protein